MSQNAAVVTAIADAVGRRDLDGLMTHLAEDIEHRDAAQPGVRRGRAAIREHFLELWRDHPQAAFSVDEVLEDGDWVVVRQRWRGLRDGERTTWVARRFVGGRVKRIDVCSTREQALEVAGLTAAERRA